MLIDDTDEEEPLTAVAHAAQPIASVEAGTVPAFAMGPARGAGILLTLGGATYVTAMAKASFILEDGWFASTAPDPFVERDRYWRNDPRQSVEDQTDIVPYLPRGEVLLKGTAFVRENERTTTRLLIQEPGGRAKIDKLADLRGDLDMGRGGFVTIPLRYEYAEYDALSNPLGRTEQSMGGPARIVNPRSGMSPAQGLPGGQGAVGFSADAYHWEVRAKRLRPGDADGLRKSPVQIPQGFSWDALSAAPADQRIQGFFQGNERIYLEGFHAKHTVIDGQLPRVVATGMLYTKGSEAQSIRMSLDTLRIDLDRRIVSSHVARPRPGCVFGTDGLRHWCRRSPDGRRRRWPCLPVVSFREPGRRGRQACRLLQLVTTALPLPGKLPELPPLPFEPPKKDR